MLLNSQKKRTRGAYLIDYRGFPSVFGADLAFAERRSHVRFPQDLAGRLAGASSPHTVLAAAISDGLRQLKDTRGDYDLVWLYLPDVAPAGFYGTEADPFDLHQFVKGTSAALGVPTQMIQEDTAKGRRDPCSVAWTLGLACCAKAGGTPYKVDRADDGTAFLGLAYAMRKVPGGDGVRDLLCAGLRCRGFRSRVPRLRAIL